MRFALSPATAVIAVVKHVASTGPVVRLDLEREDNGSSLEAAIPREIFRALGVEIGDRVGVAPRNLRIFESPGGTSPARV